MFNLLSNAAKFTPDNGNITIEAEQMGNDLIIHVIDNGVGVVTEEWNYMGRRSGLIMLSKPSS